MREIQEHTTTLLGICRGVFYFYIGHLDVTPFVLVIGYLTHSLFPLCAIR